MKPPNVTMQEIIERNMKNCKPLSSASLWGDEEFADATIVMGDRTWKVHRWVVCKQSDYFMKAFEGKFVEGNEKKIDLTGNPYTADEVNSLLMFLYTMEDDSFLKTQVLRVYGVADYFQVDHLRYRALDCLHSNLQNSAYGRLWDDYVAIALTISEKYPAGDVQQVLVEVTAKHIPFIMYDTGTMIWEKLKDAQPKFVEQVLKARYPKSHEEGAHLRESDLFRDSERVAARAAQAAQASLPVRSRADGSPNHARSIRVPFRSFCFRTGP